MYIMFNRCVRGIMQSYSVRYIYIYIYIIAARTVRKERIYVKQQYVYIIATRTVRI